MKSMVILEDLFSEMRMKSYYELVRYIAIYHMNLEMIKDSSNLSNDKRKVFVHNKNDKNKWLVKLV
jgi:hypothetical protein